MVSCHTAACRLKPAPGNHAGKYLTVDCALARWPVVVHGYEGRTEWEDVHEMEVHRTLAEGFCGEFRDLSEWVLFGEHLDAVHDLHNIRCCHTAERVNICIQLAKWRSRLLFEMPRDLSDRFLRHPPNEFVGMLCEDRPILLAGSRLELMMRHFPADTPVLAIVHDAKIPRETNTARKHLEG